MKSQLCFWSIFCACFVRRASAFCGNTQRLLSIPSKTTHQRTLCFTIQYACNQPRKLLQDVEETVVILYHKPPNVVTSHSNADAAPRGDSKEERTTVYRDVETLKGYCGDAILSLDELGIHSKLHAIGRLDVDTTGLLLLTNDGGLVHHVTNPTTASGKSIPKTYQAIIMGFWNDTSPEFEEMRLHGVAIGAKYGGQTRPPVSLYVLDHPTSKSTRVEITINEGKNRQVRRMFHAIGSGVMKLARTGIGGGDDGSRLTLGDLQQGQWRVLTNDEVDRHLDWKPRVLTTTESVTNSGKSGRPGRRQGASKRRNQESRQRRRRR